MNRAALVALLRRAEETQSDALVIRHRDRITGEWHFGHDPAPIETMSCTKAVVSLAIGMLIDDGAIAGLDQPVYDFYPEWKQGNKQRITMRHLLNQTSGLQNERDTSVEIYPSPDVVRLALAAELTDPPGAWLAYNNKAVNLLAGIVERAAGQRLDHYLRDRLFHPLGITEFDWMLDPSGTPYAMAGLRLHAGDLAKIGQLVLNRGRWIGAPVVSSDWITTSCRPGQSYNPLWGLFWQRIPDHERYLIDDAKLADLRVAGVRDGLLQSLQPLVNRTFDTRNAYYQALAKTLGPDWMTIVDAEVNRKGLHLSHRNLGNIIGVRADGWLGQYLIILSAPQLVAVRLIREKPDYNPETDVFADFEARVRALADDK